MSRNVVILKSFSQVAGGLEKYTKRLKGEFLNQGCTVHIPSFSIGPWPNFLRLRQFDQVSRKWLQTHPADVVLGMDRTTAQTHLRAGNGVHAAYLQSRKEIEGTFKHWMHSINPLHRTLLSLEKQAFEHPCLKRLFTNSEMVKKQILEYYSVNPAKIKVIHNGVEWKEMKKDFEKWQEGKKKVCQQYSLDPDGFYFLFMGNGYLRKGLHLLLKALSDLKRKDVYLCVVGKDKKQMAYQKKAVELGLEKNVHFFGYVSKTLSFYQLSDALVIPSHYDPFANVTVEALAMGLFVISSPMNGGSEVLPFKHGVVAELHREALHQALQQALERPKTSESAASTRNSIQHLDFSTQLQRLVNGCLA